MQYDVVIIGAGPGGLAAAKGAKDAGAEKVIVLERDDRAGGILNQCIHDGFGLIRYGEQLTGPEYARRAEKEASGVEIMLGHQVVSISKNKEVTAISKDGLKKFQAKAIILSTGCRERTRGAISIPGSRPAGVFTAGVVQNLVNVKNVMPGKNVVILGSGDVGMIMARRLTLEGASVKAVIEILPEPAGLARNVQQCLYDFGIPIRCSHTVSKIIGKKKIEAVEISAVDDKMRSIKGTEEIVFCDCLILSVGLIPENEVAETAGVALNAKTNGAETDEFLQTSVPCIFSCGNSRKIMDLADFVSQQGEFAGRNAVALINGQPMKSWKETTSSSMKKGYPIPGTVTCSLCPNGCQIKWDGQSYTGNNCQRGIAFAEQERINPMRIVTTTVKVISENQSLIPVRTISPINKVQIPRLFRTLHDISVSAPLKVNDKITDFVITTSEVIS